MRDSSKLSLTVIAVLSACAFVGGSSSGLVKEAYDYVKKIIAEENNLVQATTLTLPTTEQQWTEFHVNGDGHDSAYLSTLANFIQDFAVLVNARTIEEIERLDFSDVTDPVVLMSDKPCSAADLDCTLIDHTYRTLSGVCNNLDNPHWGSASTAQPRLIRPWWENVALISSYTEASEFYTHVNPIGVNLVDSQLRFHVRGDGPFSLVLGSSPQCDTIPCSGHCAVEGFILSASNVSPGNQCKKYTIQGDTIVLGPGCPHTYEFKICFMSVTAEVVLNPAPNSQSELKVGGISVDTYTSIEPMFPALDDGVSAVFSLRVDDGSVRICPGCECSPADAILEGVVEGPSFEMYFGGDHVFAQFPVENALILWTASGETRHLNDAPWVYSRRSVRFGVSADLASESVQLILKDSNGDFVASVQLGPSTEGILSVHQSITNSQTHAAFTGLYSANEDFIDGRDKVYTGFLAVYLTWIDETLFVGVGNLLGRNVLQWLPIPTPPLEVTSIELVSSSVASWVFDIEQMNKPRVTSSCGLPLPTARDVSLLVHSTDEQPTVISNRLTLYTMQYGQFIDHDYTRTPGESMTGDGPIVCADNYVPVPPDNLSRYCYNIEITNVTDYAESQGNFPDTEFEVIPFIRSASVIQCGDDVKNIQFRHNQNVVTSFIDGSALYNSHGNANLRQGATGAMLEVDSNNELAANPNHDGHGTPNCNRLGLAPDHYCRKAGDGRANEQPALLAMHTLWAREHNRIAQQLIDLGWPVDSDEANEIVFQKARRIVVAELQVITFEEYLRAFMDFDIMSEYQLGFDQGHYDPTINPSSFNLNGIANRFGHTWIQKVIAGSAELLADNFFKPELSYTNGTDDVLKTYHMVACPHTDTKVEKSVTDNLFSNINGNPHGSDLASRNVQRGRDHGMPSYCTLRAYYNLTVPSTFDDLLTYDLVRPEVVERLRAAYDSVCDIDIFTVVLSEKILVERLGMDSESDIGELLNYIEGDFFHRVKHGDRYWYEFDDAGLNKAQIRHLQEASSLSRVVCDNTDIEEIQFNAFILISESNPLVSCDSLTALDVRLLQTEHKPKGSTKGQEQKEHQPQESKGKKDDD